jgi:valyl-tRNA synthetase
MQPQQHSASARPRERQFPDGINAYGTDALRFTFYSLASTGRDIRFDLGPHRGLPELLQQDLERRALCAHELRGPGLRPGPDCARASLVSPSDGSRRPARNAPRLEKALADYRFDRASQLLYDFIWNEYCDWYLELAKTSLRSDDDSRRRAVRHTLVRVLERSLRALHPFMPFITEEIWQNLEGR